MYAEVYLMSMCKITSGLFFFISFVAGLYINNDVGCRLWVQKKVPPPYFRISSEHTNTIDN